MNLLLAVDFKLALYLFLGLTAVVRTACALWPAFSLHEKPAKVWTIHCPNASF